MGQTPDHDQSTVTTRLRQQSQRILAHSDLSDIDAVWRHAGLPTGDDGAVRLIRGPETGLMMVRGRMGGDGPPFNLGEMTVTRCSVSVAGSWWPSSESAADDVRVGHGYVAGRSQRHATYCALADAMAQSPAGVEPLQENVLTPLAERLAQRQQDDAQKAAASKVDFFTVVRGEDP